LKSSGAPWWIDPQQIHSMNKQHYEIDWTYPTWSNYIQLESRVSEFFFSWGLLGTS
jgi:hypothetical protein